MVAVPSVVWAKAPPASAEAERLATQALALHDAGKFRDAAEKFMQAYALSKKAVQVRNAAKAYEKAGMPEEALAHWTLYKSLKVPAAKRQEAEEAIARIKAPSKQGPTSDAVEARRREEAAARQKAEETRQKEMEAKRAQDAADKRAAHERAERARQEEARRKADSDRRKADEAWRQDIARKDAARRQAGRDLEQQESIRKSAQGREAGGKGLSTAAFVIGSVGLVAGGVSYLVASKRLSDLDGKLNVPDGDKVTAISVSDARSELDTINTLRFGAGIAAGLGVAAVAAGWLLWPSGADGGPQAIVVPGGAVVGFSGNF